MKKSMFLVLALLLAGCQGGANNSSQTSQNPSNSSSIESPSTSNEPSSSSSTLEPSSSVTEPSSSSEASSSSSSILVERIDASIENENIEVGDLFDVKVYVVPNNASNKEYEISSLDESILKVEGDQIRALKVGETSLHIVSKDGNASLDLPVKVNNLSILSIEKLLADANDIEKTTLSKTILKGEEISSYDHTSYERTVSFYEDQITSITNYFDVDSEEETISSTEYKYWGDINGEQKVLQKTVPNAEYLDGITDFGVFDSTELYYDSETAEVGLMNAIHHMMNDSSYAQLDDSLTSSYEDGKLTIHYEHGEEKEGTWYWEDSNYIKTQVDLVFLNNKVDSFHFIQNKYSSYSLDDNTFDEETKTMKDFNYSFTWNGRLNEALNVNPSDFLLKSFEIKTYSDSACSNESTTFKVGDDIYFEMSNATPENAFNELTITSESLGGEVYISTYYGVSITCQKSGDVKLIFTAAGGASQTVLIHIEAVAPTSISFDSWMSKEVAVGNSLNIWTTVSPSNADCEVLIEIIDGEEFATLGSDGTTLIGVKEGKVTLKATCVGYEDVFCTTEINVIAGAQ